MLLAVGSSGRRLLGFLHLAGDLGTCEVTPYHVAHYKTPTAPSERRKW